MQEPTWFVGHGFSRAVTSNRVIRLYPLALWIAS